MPPGMMWKLVGIKLAVAIRVVAEVAVVADLEVVVAEVVGEVGRDQGRLMPTWPASRHCRIVPLSLLLGSRPVVGLPHRQQESYAIIPDPLDIHAV